MKSVKMNFKTPRQEIEFASQEINPRLFVLIMFIASYMRLKYSYSITITEIFRTDLEQDNIYLNNPKYKEKKWKSVHQEWRGADIRTNDMTAEMIADVLRLCDLIHYSAEHKTAIYHDVGYGKHIHIQVA